jgi:hypothetical protein
MSPCSTIATEQWGATSTYIFATHVKLSSAVLSTLPTPPKPTTLPTMPVKLAENLPRQVYVSKLVDVSVRDVS